MSSQNAFHGSESDTRELLERPKDTDIPHGYEDKE